MPCVADLIRCCVLNCPNETKHGARLYRFPVDKARLHKWITYCGRESGWTPDINSRLCELHFDDNQFVGGYKEDKWRPLKPEAIPNRHYLSVPWTTGRKLRLLRDQAALQDKFIHSGRNNSGDSEITSCPASHDHSGTVNTPQDSLKMPKKGAAGISESILGI